MVTEAPGEVIQSVELLGVLLHDGNDLVKANALKCIANVAVHPRARAQMRTSNNCLALLDELSESANLLVSKHASIAKRAVLWKP